MHSQECAPLKHHYDHCVERVTKQQEEHGKAHEDCVEECKFAQSAIVLELAKLMSVSYQSSTLLTAQPRAPHPSSSDSSGKLASRSGRVPVRSQAQLLGHISCQSNVSPRDMDCHTQDYSLYKPPLEPTTVLFSLNLDIFLMCLATIASMQA